MPKPGTQSEFVPVPHVPHTVVSTWDHRHDGEPLDYVITAQPTHMVQAYKDFGRPISTDFGAYLGLDDIEILADQPRITFTAKEPTT